MQMEKYRNTLLVRFLVSFFYGKVNLTCFFFLMRCSTLVCSWLTLGLLAAHFSSKDAFSVLNIWQRYVHHDALRVSTYLCAPGRKVQVQTQELGQAGITKCACLAALLCACRLDVLAVEICYFGRSVQQNDWEGFCHHWLHTWFTFYFFMILFVFLYGNGDTTLSPSTFKNQISCRTESAFTVRCWTSWMNLFTFANAKVKKDMQGKCHPVWTCKTKLHFYIKKLSNQNM